MCDVNAAVPSDMAHVRLQIQLGVRSYEHYFRLMTVFLDAKISTCAIQYTKLGLLILEWILPMKTKSEYSANQAHILALAIDTFGSTETAEVWMNDYNLLLGGTPLTIAESEPGMQEVKKILGAISYGGAA